MTNRERYAILEEIEEEEVMKMDEGYAIYVTVKGKKGLFCIWQENFRTCCDHVQSSTG